MNPRHDVDPHEGQGTSHEPTPTIWPVGFAVGIACIFVGLIISTIVLAVGVVVVATRGEPLAILEVEFNKGDLAMLAACVLYAF